MVTAWFAELRDGVRVHECIDADAGMSDLERKVARQIALRIVLAQAVLD